VFSQTPIGKQIQRKR